jgi:hypothetical protein
MAEPSLSEITNIQGNPAIGAAGTGVADNVIAPNTTELTYLSQAADARQKAADFIAKQHQDNLTNNLKNFNDTDVTGVYSPDYNKITGDYQALTKDISDNYDVLSNPNKNPQLYSSLMQRIAGLKANISESKQRAAIDKDYELHLAAHPELRTVQNQGQLQKLRNSTLGTQYEIPTLQSPPITNPEAAILAFTDAAKTASTTPTETDVQTPDGLFQKQKINHTDPEKFKENFLAIAKGNDPSGRPWKDATQPLLDLWNQSHPAAQMTYDDWINKEADIKAKELKDQQISQTLSGNPIAEEKMRSKTEYGISALNFQHELALEKQRASDALALAEKKGELKISQKETNNLGTILNNQTAQLFNPENYGTHPLDYYENGVLTKNNVVNAPPSTLEAFGYEKQDASTSNKKVIVKPDYLIALPDGNIRAVFYQKGSGKTITNGGSGNGAAKIDKDHTQDYTRDQARSALLNVIPPTQREKVGNAALTEAPSLNNPDVLNSYLKARPKSTPESTSTTIKVTGNSDPLGILQ